MDSLSIKWCRVEEEDTSSSLVETNVLGGGFPLSGHNIRSYCHILSPIKPLHYFEGELTDGEAVIRVV